jgi:hypothetical protein
MYFGLTLVMFLAVPLWLHYLKAAEQPTQTHETAPLLISYAYYQKDEMQIANLDFFLTGWQ